jgi:hypothetical protein
LSQHKARGSRNIVMVLKNYRSTRFCVEYRQVNLSVKTHIRYLERTIAWMSWPAYVGLLHCTYGAHIVSLKWIHHDADMTAYICREGDFRCRTMPYSLSNANPTLKRLMDILMVKLKFESIPVYLGKTIIFFPDLDQHRENLQQVLQCL